MATVPPQGHIVTSDFQRLFAASYPFQTSVMSNLNRLDFRNLRLAGIRTSVSQRVQREILLPTKCDGTILQWPGPSPAPCPNNSDTVDEVRFCRGPRHDGWMSEQAKQNELTNPFKYGLQLKHYMHLIYYKEGQFSSTFNVCSECRDSLLQLQHLLRVPEKIDGYHTALCRAHSLEYVQQRPYDSCRCVTFMENYWRCSDCSNDSETTLRVCAMNFGCNSVCPRYVFNKSTQKYVNPRNGKKRRVYEVCPISGCGQGPWCEGPSDKQMQMCRACTAIFSPDPGAWNMPSLGWFFSAVLSYI